MPHSAGASLQASLFLLTEKANLLTQWPIATLAGLALLVTWALAGLHRHCLLWTSCPSVCSWSKPGSLPQVCTLCSSHVECSSTIVVFVFKCHLGEVGSDNSI